jgi:hypothetical protein
MSKASAVIAMVVVLCIRTGGAEPPAGDPLAALGWLVGGTWVAEIQNSGGQPMRVESRFEWAEHGRALKYVIHFKAGDRVTPQYEGVYFWHPGKKQITMIQTDRNGNLTESVATMDGTTLKQENVATQSDGTSRPQRISVARRGDDAFDFKALVQRDGEWVEGAGFTYRRQRSAAK